MTYCDKDIWLNPGVGGQPANHVFRINSIYDTDFTALGHQPLGYDEMSALYGKYTVIGVKATYQFNSQDSSYSNVVGMGLSTTSAGVTNIENMVENGKCRWKLVPPASHSNNLGKDSLSLRINPNKFLGVSHPMSEDTVQADTSSNPEQLCYLKLTCGPQTADDAYGVRGVLKLDFTVIWSEPKTLTVS